MYLKKVKVPILRKPLGARRDARGKAKVVALFNTRHIKAKYQYGCLLISGKAIVYHKVTKVV